MRESFYIIYLLPINSIAMKKLIISFFLILPTLLVAQIDRSKQPSPGKAPAINIKDSEVFTTSNGITVILSENHKLPRVSFDLQMGADPIMQGSKAGLTDMVSELILSGTSKRSKDQLDNETDYIGASLSASESSLYMSCLTKHLNKGLELLSDVLYNANFPQEEFDRIKKQMESNLIAAKSEPDQMAGNAEAKVNFPNHPYGDVMTEATLNSITRDDVTAYFRSTFTPKGSYLVIVGDITKDEASKLVETYFSKWSGGDPFKMKPNNGATAKGNQVYFVKKPGAVQSVVAISFPLNIKTGDTDQLPLNVLNGILGGGGFGTRLMQNLREDKAYTYGCYSSLNVTEDGSWVSIGGNFRNEVSDSAITQILFELDKITNEYVTDDELNLTKASMAGGFARSLERPQTIARFALNIIRNNLSKDYYQTYLKRLEAVDKELVLTMAQKYFTAKNCNIVVVGNEDVIERLKAFDADGKITLLDAFGNEVKEMKQSDLTKEQIVEKYLYTVTKSSSLKEMAKKTKKIKSIEKKMDVSIAQAPFPLKSTDLWIAPNLTGEKLEGQGMVFQKTYFDGTKGESSSMGGKKELSADEIASKQKMKGMYPEMSYQSEGIVYEVLGVDLIDGKEMYVIKIKDGNNESFDYFDKQSFLKIRTIAVTKEGDEVNETSINYADYFEVDGFLFPKSVTINMGEAVFAGKVSSISFNSKTDLNEYK